MLKYRIKLLGIKVLKINWQDFKEYKYNRQDKAENFEILLDFMKSYYSIINPVDMYEILADDELAVMMLDKRDIKSPESLEKYLFKIKNA